MPSVSIAESAAMRGQLVTAKAALQYVLGGHSFFTVVRKENGHRYTYKVVRRELEEEKVVHYVHVLWGPDNSSDYRYLGTVYGESVFRLTRKSKLPLDDNRIKVFVWLLEKLHRGHIPAGVEVWHEGRCGRCGRKLTVPESIERGLGPECSAQMGLAF